MRHVRPRSALACALLGLAPSVASALTLNLDGATLPGAVSLTSNTTFTASSGVSLTSYSSLPDDAAEGYVSLSWTHANLSQISNLPVALQVVRRNAVDDLSFEMGTLCSGSTGWYDCSASGVSAAASPFGGGNAAQFTIASASAAGTQVYTQQRFTIDPGELYRVRYRLDVDGMDATSCVSGAEAFLEVRFRYTDNGSAAVFPSRPSSSASLDASDPTRIATTATTPYERLVRYYSTHPTGHASDLVVTPDCDDPGTSADDRYVFDDGTDQITFERYSSSTCDDDLYYAQVVFLMNTGDCTSSATSTAYIDDVWVDWDRQVEVEIVDTGSGAVLQRSTLDTGFFVEDVASNADYTGSGVTMRVNLRSQSNGVSPLLKKIHIGEDAGFTVAINARAQDFSDPRLGVDMHLPPREEFDDPATFGAMRTECEDVYGDLGGGFVPCWELFAYYGLINQRMYLEPSALEWTGSAWSTTTLTSLGDARFDRIGEAVAEGLDILMLYAIHGSPDDGVGDDGMTIWDGSCNLAYDDGGPDSDADQSKNRVTEVFPILTDMLVSLGYADDFEIFNEPNLSEFEPECPSLIAASEVPQLMDDTATAINALSLGANLSFSGLASNGQRIYDTDYLGTDLLPDLTRANFHATNFHPYSDTYLPEDIGFRFAAVDSTLSSASWLPVNDWFTESAYSLAEFDPDCTSDGDTTSYWTARGFGEKEQAKLLARSTLTQLGLATEKVLIWGQMSNEKPYDGPINATYDEPDPCWRSIPSQNKILFERDVATGLLADVNGASEYSPNQGGRFLLTIADWLTESDPFSLTSVGGTGVGGSSLPADERYYASAQETPDGFVVAVWWFKYYTFGAVRYDLGELTDVAYQNLLYGAEDACASSSVACGVKDYGFEDRRRHDVTITGIPSPGSITAAYRVDLASNNQTAISYSVTGSTVTVPDVVIGEEPVLLFFDK